MTLGTYAPVDGGAHGRECTRGRDPHRGASHKGHELWCIALAAQRPFRSMPEARGTVTVW